MANKPQWENPRGLRERIAIQGLLLLQTPTHLGCGDAEGLLDMGLQRDPTSGRALLTGSTLAGALRGYLTGLGAPWSARARRLFGEVAGQESRESLLIVEDALSLSSGARLDVEVRDGVALSTKRRAAEDEKKFDMELLTAGTQFLITLELLVPSTESEEMLETLAVALQALQKGEISLGKRKHRGFGQCQVEGWRVWRFNMQSPEGLKAWLEAWPLPEHPDTLNQPEIAPELLGRMLSQPESIPEFKIEATFALASPLLIRAEPVIEWDGQQHKVKASPDLVHLHSKRAGRPRPIISGTSLAGALRARSLRIANCLGMQGEQVIARLFGSRPPEGQRGDTQGWTASRLWFQEAEVTASPESWVQNRLMIDRLTGGAYTGALFSEQPIFPKPGSQVTLKFSLRLDRDDQGAYREQDIGLLLLLLKDLWTGDLPLGGESSVGRGRLRGISARLSYRQEHWEITALDTGDLQVTGSVGNCSCPADRLNEFVTRFAAEGAKA